MKVLVVNQGLDKRIRQRLPQEIDIITPQYGDEDSHREGQGDGAQPGDFSIQRVPLHKIGGERVELPAFRALPFCYDRVYYGIVWGAFCLLLGVICYCTIMGMFRMGRVVPFFRSPARIKLAEFGGRLTGFYLGKQLLYVLVLGQDISRP